MQSISRYIAATPGLVQRSNYIVLYIRGNLYCWIRIEFKNFQCLYFDHRRIITYVHVYMLNLFAFGNLYIQKMLFITNIYVHTPLNRSHSSSIRRVHWWSGRTNRTRRKNVGYKCVVGYKLTVNLLSYKMT